MDESPTRVVSFFAPSPLTRPGARRILEAKANAISSLQKKAPRSFDLTETIRRISPKFTLDPPSLHVNQQPLVAGRPTRRRDTSTTVTSSANDETLIQDMALATKIFSARRLDIRPSFSTSGALGDADIEDISAATNQLSISISRPARHVYQYLRPLFANSSEASPDPPEVSSAVAVRDHGESMGARLLMAEWTLNTDPEDYQYQNPYDDESAHGAWQQSSSQAPKHNQVTNSRAAVPQSMPTRPTIVASKPRQPPMLAVSKPQITMPCSQPTAQANYTASQPTGFDTMAGSSQNFALPSTQILPGPHGGRLSAPAKKPAKKRMGGF